MLEMLNKESFPLLPFGPDIPYLTINSCSDDIQQNCLNDNEVDIFPPDETFIEQIEIQQKKGTKKKKKTFVKLNEKAANFRYSFYKMFTSKKKFPKKFVCQIHNEIRSRLRLKKITREETRSIDLYFLHYADVGRKILLYIENNKLLLIQKIPDLKNFIV